ncbi:MAG: hypothetical protein OEO83_05635, partial [Alphaproteobacteria bacterium]|nr:hypothetical protein [Alphaproteobacteria bacterium]
MVNKFAAGMVIVLGVILTALAGWGLIYLPDQMAKKARLTIANLQEVLARDAPSLTLAHGDISANPFTARVTVADVSLARPGGEALRARTLGFSIDPFSRKLSAIDATLLRLDRPQAQLRIDKMLFEGVSPETLRLLDRAARGEATVEDIIRDLRIPRLAFSGINVTAPRDGEANLQRIALEGVEKGRIASFSLEGFNLYKRGGRNPGEFALDRMALGGLNLSEFLPAVMKGDFWPQLTQPVIGNFSFEGFRLLTEEGNFSMRRGALEAAYAKNDAGRPYARKAQFLIDDLIVKPVRGNPQFRDFLQKTGMTQLAASVKIVSASDHQARTVAMEELSFRVPELADFNFSFILGKMPKMMYELTARPEDTFAFMAAMGDATINGASFTINNTNLVQATLAQASERQGIDAKALIASFIAQARAQADRQGQRFFHAIIDEVEKF